MSISPIGIALFAFSTLLRIGTQVQQVRQQQVQQTQQNALVRHQSQVATNNAQIARDAAAEAILIGEAEKREVERRAVAVRGAQEAGFAGAGVLTSGEGALSLIANTADLFTADAREARRNRQVEAVRRENQARGFEAESGALAASQTNVSGALPRKILGTLLSGASTAVANKWLVFNTKEPLPRDPRRP